MRKKNAPLAATAPAGAEFEVKVGSSYLLSMLADSPARGLPNSTIESVSFQQGDDGHPMDDVIVKLKDSEGNLATLEIQVKRSITFAPKDDVFKKVMSQVVDTVKQEGFWERNVQLIVATLQTSRQISGPYREVLSWARETATAEAFFGRLRRRGTAGDHMRSFVSTTREHLETFGAGNEDLDVWRLLRRFQILTFDFSKDGGAEDYWSIERAKGILPGQEYDRAASLWSSTIAIGLAIDAVGGSCTRVQLIEKLSEDGFALEPRWNTRDALRKLAEASAFAMDDVSDSIANTSIARRARTEAVQNALTKGRYLEIQGGSGVGKSAVLKRFACEATRGRSILFLSPNRTIPGGWQALRSQLGFLGSARDFFVELSAAGNPILCIDNLDFFSEQEKVTVKDLVRAAKDVSGVQIIVTCRIRLEFDEPNWLPANTLDDLGRAPAVIIDELNQEEIDELSAQDHKLAALLVDSHPAKQVARNLFRLSRLMQMLPVFSQPRTEVELAKLWWTTGDGKNDDGRRDRQRLLIAAAQYYVQSNGVFDSSAHSSKAIQDLVSSETLLDHGNDQLSFKHDVLREWAVACLYDSQEAALLTIDHSKSSSESLVRSFELQSQMLLEAGDKSGWVSRLKDLSQPHVHKSWYRAAILAIVRSESSAQLLKGMTAELLEGEAEIARQLVVLAVASESQPLQELFPEHELNLPSIPEGISAPKNASWSRLVVWLLRLDRIPARLVPAATDLLRYWMIGLVGYAPFVEPILSRFHDWLIEIESAKYPKSFRDRSEPFDGALSADQIKSLEDNLRSYFYIFSEKAPALAQKYLKHLMASSLPDHIVTETLKMSGTLAKAAPKELAELTRSALITDIPSGKRRREDYDQGLSYTDSQFIPASPAQGPFYKLLTDSPHEGLRLVNDLVNHVVDFQIDTWGADDEAIVIPFGESDRSFRYSQSFHWSRHSSCYSVTSALMALEAWGHKRIENGDMPSQAVHDLLGLENTSVAILAVAIDIMLSSNKTTFADLLPLLASPELVAIDRMRPNIQDPSDFDPFGLSSLQQEPIGEVSTSFLKQRVSRQTCLERVIPQFAFHAGEEMRETLKHKLEAASKRLGQPEVGDNFATPRLMALYLLCQLDLENYQKNEILTAEGKPVEMMEFKAPPELSKFTDPLDELLKDSIQHMEESSVAWNAGLAVEDASKGTHELAVKAVDLAKSNTSDDKQTLDFVAATAVLVLRDGSSELRNAHRDWAVAKLTEFGTQDGDYHDGAFSFLRYNRAALALMGLSFDSTPTLVDARLHPILKTAAKHPYAIAPGLNASLERLVALNPKLPKSIVRVAIAACVFPWKDWRNEIEYKARKSRSTARIDKAVEAEIAWVLYGGNEPNWPELPPTQPKIRHGIRIGRIPAPESDDIETSSTDEVEVNPDDLIFDDRSAARIIMATTPAARSDWLLEILDSFWPFTKVKNGLEAPSQRVDPPREWNECYYALLAEATAILTPQDATSLLTKKLVALPDESFVAAVAPFLQNLDEMTFGNETISVEVASGFREVVAERMMSTAQWRRLAGDTSHSMSTEFRPAISSLFFNSANAFSPPNSRLLEPDIRQLDPAIPLLVKCISDAPSYAVAVFTMNLVEVVFMPSQKPMVLALTNACLNKGITEWEFWIESKFGAKICNYFEAFLDSQTEQKEVTELSQELDNVLNQLILIGVPEAQRLHDKLLAFKC